MPRLPVKDMIMADSFITEPGPRRIWAKIDKTLLVIFGILAVLAALDITALGPVIWGTLGSFAHTLPFILFAVLAVAYLKAAGAEQVLARAFEGPQWRMIVLAALLGGLSPFCSCEVIPFVAALLAVGVPLAPVMAFWLASPLMDPAMFAITAGTLGFDFAMGKTLAAVALGILGGAVAMLARNSAVFADPLRAAPQSCSNTSCCSGPKPFTSQPVWRFWQKPERAQTFRATATENLLFLGKWLLLAYLLESLMTRYVPADWIAGLLGGQGVGPILLGALVGAPAYLNGYAAVPLIAGLLEQGMKPGAAMSFVIAGGVSCIPAAVAVWALVKPRVFAAYIGLALSGAVLAGLAWGAIA
ncbi:MAG: permease [Mangrovicoccus sp.]|nr:permease [Mangrovicoccus sp.]